MSREEETKEFSTRKGKQLDEQRDVRIVKETDIDTSEEIDKQTNKETKMNERANNEGTGDGNKNRRNNNE